MFNQKTDLKYEVPYEKKISRLFIFRFLWMFIEMWVIWIWGMWIGIIAFLHFWYMLILGRRHKGLWKRKVRFMRHIAKWTSYLHNTTDRRPDFIED
jgi:hypothetical protein